MARLELYGTARCPYTGEMRDWLEWKRSEFVEYDVEADADVLARLVTAPAKASPVKASPVLFLSCEDSSGITGASVLVDAGYLAAAEWETRGETAFAAGAKEVMTLHETPIVIRSEADIARIAEAPFGPNQHTMFSAHQMGGMAMGDDPTRSVVDSRGRHHAIENLWIVDGSIFPTSLGVNPQLSIYAHARLFATEIAKTRA